MGNKNTVWLVRTRAGEILGPFKQDELVAALKVGTFTGDDEIAPAGKDWVSAHALASREVDEFTQTSTQHQTVTRPLTQSEFSASHRPSYSLEDDLTPTPTATTADHEITQATEPDITIRPVETPKPQGVRPVVLIFTITFFIGWVLYLLVKTPVQDTVVTSSILPKEHSENEESPFVSRIYALISAGKRQQALKELVAHHQRAGSHNDQEYKILYAALLITEKESSTRAQKLLKEVLSSDVTTRLKAMAQRWLGYQLLSEEKKDMGVSYFLDALQLTPKDAAARFNLGRAYLKQQKYNKALEFFRLAETELNSSDQWLIQIYKGRAKAALGQLQEARVGFRTAMEMGQDRWLTYVYYALFLKAIDDRKEAQDVLHNMLTRDPHYEINTPAPFGFYQERVNYAEYMDSYAEVMKKSSSSKTELGRLYLAYLLAGPTSNEGMRIVKRAEQQDMKRNLRWKIIALKVLLDQNSNKETIQNILADLPINLSEFGYYAYVLRGEALVRLNRIKDAQQDFQRALLLEPKTAVSRLAYAILLKKTSRRSEARSEINHLLTYHPHYIPAIVSSQNF